MTPSSLSSKRIGRMTTLVGGASPSPELMLDVVAAGPPRRGSASSPGPPGRPGLHRRAGRVSTVAPACGGAVTGDELPGPRPGSRQAAAGSARKNAPNCAFTSGVSSRRIRSATSIRSRWPCIRPAIRARLDSSQSLARVVSRRLATIRLTLSFSSATSPLRLDGDGAGHVALGHGGGDLGDRADLGGQVEREFVDAGRQPLPGAVDALDPRLAAELALAADLAGHAGDLGGERGQRVDHGVDGRLQLQDLAARVHVDLLGQVALGDGGGHLGDVADLGGQVVRHVVDVVGEVLPDAGDAAAPGRGRRAGRRCRPRGPPGSPRRRTPAAARPSC